MAERVSFAGRILEKQGLHIAGGIQEPLKTVAMEDAYGTVSFVCMPLVRPVEAGAATSSHMLGFMDVP